MWWAWSVLLWTTAIFSNSNIMSQRVNWNLDAVPKRILIYVLTGYVLLQFGWWAYMLVDLNNEAYHLRLEMLDISGMPAPEAQIQKSVLDAKLSQRIWMVLGEGAVFVFILMLGFRVLQRTISRELELAAQQKNFLLSVTHELKSPLAAIKLQLQTLSGRNLLPDQCQLIYARALMDTGRLQDLVENLLLVNRVEAGKFPLHLSVVDISALINELCKRHFHTQLESDTIRLNLDMPLLVDCNKEALQSILINLVENALKYASASQIEIGTSVDMDRVLLYVSDSGKGIPDADKHRVFQRFFRLGNEDTRSTKGTGIGLYLVKQLVQMQKGTIQIVDNLPQGARFEVSFPHSSK